MGSTRRAHRIASLVLLAALLGGLLTALTQAIAPTPARAVAPGTLTLTTARDLVTEPTTGRVFVSGDDAVEVLAADGTPIAKITDVFGASGLDVAQGYVWAAESTAAAIAKIDPATMAVVQTYPVGTTVRDAIAVVGNAVFIGTRTGNDVLRLDLGTGTVTPFGASLSSPLPVRIPGTTSALLVVERTSYEYATVTRRSTTAPFTVLATGGWRGMQDAVVTGDGARTFIAGRNSSGVAEAVTSTAKLTGLQLQGVAAASGVTWSPGHGGTLARANGPMISTFQVGRADPVATSANLGAQVGAVGLSADADTAYALLVPQGGVPPVPSVAVVDVRPTVGAAQPATAPAGAPTEVTLSGTGLGHTSGVTVGGVAAMVTASTAGSVRFTMPTSLAPGTQAIAVTGPTGTATSSILVVAAGGATVQGTVARAGAPLAGAPVALGGGPLGAPITTTTAADGTYAFSGLAFGETYAVTVDDPAGLPSQTRTRLRATPGATTTVDVDLARPDPTGSAVRQLDVGSPIKAVVLDRSTDRIAVSFGDEVDVFDVFDRDGALLARFPGIAGASGLSQVGSDVYVAATGLGQIVRIDLATLTRTGSWSTGYDVTGTVAYAGGRVFFDGWDPAVGGAQLRFINLTTGNTATIAFQMNAALRNVDGNADRFVAAVDTSSTVSLIDGKTSPPSTVAMYASGHSGYPYPPMLPVAGTDTLYEWGGREYTLSTLQPNGVEYQTGGPPAYTPGRGGIVAFGSKVFRDGMPTATHRFSQDPTGTALDSTAGRFVRTVGSKLLIDDLAPRVTAIAPDPLVAIDPTVTLTGTGLGVVTSVEVDGAPVPATVVDPSTVTIAMPPAGSHRVTVTTPFGTSAPAPLLVLASTVPGPVTLVSATSPGPRQARVAWNLPVRDGGSPVTGYVVTTYPGGPTCTTTGALSCDLTVAPGTYGFSVAAINANGTGPPASFWWTVTVAPAKPTAPTAVTADAGIGSATVVWQPPADDGGAPIQGYRVTAFLGGTTAVAPPTFVAAGFTATVVPNLVPGASYTFTVEAGNSAGVSPPGGPSPMVTILSTAVAPGAPGKPTAVGGDRQAVVSWTAPTTLGGSPITGYTVTASPGGQTCMAVPPTTTCTVTGLTNGVAHTFTVTATNVAGTGPASPASDPLTPLVAGGSSFVPLAPTRILDSRATEAVGPYTTPWTTGLTRSVPVAGHGGVPADATAVALNVTVTGTSVPGFLTMWPTGATQPLASSINWAGGDTVANAVTLPIGPDGTIQVFAAGGPVDVIFDVVGAYHAGAGAGLVPVAPHRILDSRPGEGVGPFTTPWGPGTSRPVTVAGVDGIPADATAVVLNVTVTSTTAASFLTLSPSGQPRPLASSLNWAAGQTTPNAVTVPVGAGGAIDVFNNSGQAHVIIDIAGWFSPTTGARFHPVAPARTLDSRPGEHVGPYTTPWGPATTRTHVARDGTTVPAGAVVVLHNTTVTGTTAASFLSLWPDGQAQPLVSNLNWAAGQTRANQTTTPLGADGSVAIYNNSGQVHVIADLTGWYG